jgi:hypothetical protein
LAERQSIADPLAHLRNGLLDLNSPSPSNDSEKENRDPRTAFLLKTLPLLADSPVAPFSDGPTPPYTGGDQPLPDLTTSIFRPVDALPLQPLALDADAVPDLVHSASPQFSLFPSSSPELATRAYRPSPLGLGSAKRARAGTMDVEAEQERVASTSGRNSPWRTAFEVHDEVAIPQLLGDDSLGFNLDHWAAYFLPQ